MTATIQKWGNSLALRIPSAIARQTRIREGDVVTLKISNSILTVNPSPRRLSLDDLLAKVTPENLHSATAWSADDI